MAETLDRLETLILAGRKTGRGHQAATVNVDFIINAHDDRDQMTLLQKAEMAMPDGMPVVWAARLLGARMPERVTGADIVLRLAERAARQGYSIYLLGATPDVAARAAEILQQKYPGLKIAGIQSPMIRSIDATDPAIIEAIRAAQPDILLVAFGNPKQEKWIAYYRRQLNVPVMMGVGGTLDFISGAKKRAPLWMQRSGLEWVFRLAQEPRRLWRRYGRDMGIFGWLFIYQWLQMRPWRRPNPAVLEPPTIHGDQAVLPLRGDLSFGDLPELYRLAEQALSMRSTVRIDLSQVSSLDAAAAGALVSIDRQAREQGGRLVLENASPRMQKTLAILHLGTYFNTPSHLNTFVTENI
jgi:N-acetylglucosaminyldiphosphoundecaprenol N-acetyl-beta-D-mannosaminyltransferase